MFKPWALPISLCDRVDPKYICAMVNNAGGSATSHRILYISLGLLRLSLAMGSGPENVHPALNNICKFAISGNALCMGLGFHRL